VTQVVLRSMKDARRKAEQMQLYLEDMVRTYDDIMTFYGEDPSDDNARRDFFAKLAVFVTEWKKSREKNVQLEEIRKRNEASMKRKHAQLKVNGAATDSSAPPSPSSAGAMDSLLEKLRAAAPQARDQRDRRRRARLQNKHQDRVASGQKIPEPDEIPEVEATLVTTESVPADGGLMSPDLSVSGASVDSKDDVAERAALLLQGMRGSDGGEDSEKRESVRRSRRRENADEERKARRRRRERAGASISEALADEAAIAEGTDEDADGQDGQAADTGAEEEFPEKLPTPTIIASPPSPDGSERKPIELDE